MAERIVIFIGIELRNISKATRFSTRQTFSREVTFSFVSIDVAHVTSDVDKTKSHFPLLTRLTLGQRKMYTILNYRENAVIPTVTINGGESLTLKCPVMLF